MMKYAYLIQTLEGKPIAVYESQDLAKKLLSSIADKIGEEVEILKIRLNPDIKMV